MKKNLFSYLTLFGALSAVVVLSRLHSPLQHLFASSSDPGLLSAFFAISSLFFLSFTIHFCAQRVHFPAFVVAIFFGIAAKPLLSGVVDQSLVLNVIVGIGATLILFGGGLETPFDNFKKLIAKILSLSFVGLTLTAFLFSGAVYWLAGLVGTPISMTVATLLGAILASTDPAAIIPVLKSLRFKNREIKDLIVSESAVTDVTGTLLTVAFLGVLLAGGTFSSLTGAYQTLLTPEVGSILFEEVLFGIIFGFVGWGLLMFLTKTIGTSGEEAEAHAAYFLFVPICIFTMAAAFHGSGYLAAFVSGLLFVISRHLHETEHFFNYTIEGFFKPTIFILLGALVDIPQLLSYAGVGILAAFVFMFVIRPLSVFVSLGLFTQLKKNRVSLNEILFISFVRETGAIPAVLLITVMSYGIPGLEGLVPIGMWVILATLIIEPPLTPLVAKYLRVATPIVDNKKLDLGTGMQPFVVLGSRGYSFLDRLPFVVQWAQKHHIYRVVVLHCPEDKYSPEFASDVGEQAKVLFQQINSRRATGGEKEIDFEYVSRTGFLQDNINILAKEQDQVTAIFVGRKVLDYRLNDIRDLRVPLFFID